MTRHIPVSRGRGLGSSSLRCEMRWYRGLVLGSSTMKPAIQRVTPGLPVSGIAPLNSPQGFQGITRWFLLGCGKLFSGRQPSGDRRSKFTPMHRPLSEPSDRRGVRDCGCGAVFSPAQHSRTRNNDIRRSQFFGERVGAPLKASKDGVECIGRVKCLPLRVSQVSE